MQVKFFFSALIIALCSFQPTSAWADGEASCGSNLKTSSGNVTYVIDTNIFHEDPDVIYQLNDGDIIVPVPVLNELDNHKTREDLGRSSREVSRILEALRERGTLAQGIQLDDGRWVRLTPTSEQWFDGYLDLEKGKPDHHIILAALRLREEGYPNVTIISNDRNMRLLASAYDLRADSREIDAPSSTATAVSTRESFVELQLGERKFEQLTQEGTIPFDRNMNRGYEYVWVFKEGGSAETGFFARIDRSTGQIKKLKALPKDGVVGIQPLSREQQLALHLLIDDEVHLVTLTGIAGTGKTLLAIAAALHGIAEGQYTNAIVGRPIVYLEGKKDPLGYLKGDLKEKLEPWIKPIKDNLDIILGAGKLPPLKGPKTYSGKANKMESPDYFFTQGVIEAEPVDSIRGRSLQKRYLIIDEAQNLSPHEIKTIITRAGVGTKVVLMGDLDQIDNPRLRNNSGLAAVIEKLAGRDIVGHVSLIQGERSPLATLAAELLK